MRARHRHELGQWLRVHEQLRAMHGHDVVAQAMHQQDGATHMASNFRLTSDTAECKIYEITGETVIYSFHSITRNITRLPFIDISR